MMPQDGVRGSAFQDRRTRVQAAEQSPVSKDVKLLISGPVQITMFRWAWGTFPCLLPIDRLPVYHSFP
jgi:hypothetical protein